MSDSEIPQTAACQASLSISNSQNLLKLMSIGSVIPSNHLILCHPLLLPPSIFPSIRVFSNESVLCIRWPKYWRFSFRISPSNEYSGVISSSYLTLWNTKNEWFLHIYSLYLNYLLGGLVTKSCSTLCHPLDCSPPGSSVHRIFQARMLEWVAISVSRGSSQPRDWNWVSWTAGRFFSNWATWEAP